MQDIVLAFLLAASLCADCFAVTSCSSISLNSVSWRNVLPTALAFAVIQTLLMLLGWLFGGIFVGVVEKAADVIAFLLLLYVGGSMIVGALRKSPESRNLEGIRNVLIGGFATSIDAVAVGISMSMACCPAKKAALNLGAVFVVTFLSVIAGMFSGCRIGRRFGRPAELAGGTVLVAIGAWILIC